MKLFTMRPEYTAELNEIAEEHLEALLALHIDSFQNGMKVGQRNTLFFMSLGIVTGAVLLCLAGITYLERKKQF